MKKFVVLLCVMMILLVGCNTNSIKTEESIDDFAVVNIDVSKVIFDEAPPENFDYPDDSYVFIRNEIYPAKSMKYQYDIRREYAVFLPKFSDLKGAEADVIRAYFKDKYEKEIAEYAPLLIDGEECFPNSATQSLYFVRNTYQYNIAGNFLSITYNNSMYSGGAHGMYGSFVEIFDLTTGELLGYNDFFGDHATANKELEPIIAGHFGEEHRVTGLRNVMQYEEYIPTFRIEESGIVFMFNPYEIASFADGMIEVLIPYNELKEILLVEIRGENDYL